MNTGCFHHTVCTLLNLGLAGYRHKQAAAPDKTPSSQSLLQLCQQKRCSKMPVMQGTGKDAAIELTVLCCVKEDQNVNFDVVKSQPLKSNVDQHFLTSSAHCHHLQLQVMFRHHRQCSEVILNHMPLLTGRAKPLTEFRMKSCFHSWSCRGEESENTNFLDNPETDVLG